MAGSINKVILIGNVGKDPVVKKLSNGSAEVASFSLVTSDSWKDRVTGEKKEKSEWHNIVIYNSPLVDLTKSYVRKGSKLYIEGSLQTRKWNDTNGSEKFITEVVLQYVCTMVLLSKSSSPSDDITPQPSSNAVKVNASINMYDDNIPF